MQFAGFVATDTTELDSWVDAVVRARKREQRALRALFREPSRWRAAGVAAGAVAALSFGALLGFAAAGESAFSIRGHPAWAGALLILASALFAFWRRWVFQRSRPKPADVIPEGSAFWLAEPIAKLRRPDIDLNALPFIPWRELFLSAMAMAFGIGLMGGCIAGG